jgi:hypothetical protein
MSKPLIHAKSSAKKYGGEWEDYIDIHTFMDSSKAAVATNLHRALTHNSWFIGVVLPRVFGEVFKRKSDGVEISTRDIGEQHVSEDFKGFIPSASDYLNEINLKPWMNNGNGAPPSYATILSQKHTGLKDAALDGSLDYKFPTPVITPITVPDYEKQFKRSVTD